jgi:F0F1-type ATP synthase membrane subunit b/b'
MRKRPITIATLLFLAGASSFAARPVRNVSPARHPNIAAAQRLVRQAFEKITAAQRANEWDLNGHAQKAKELLDQVNVELKEAAEVANKNAGR